MENHSPKKKEEAAWRRGKKALCVEKSLCIYFIISLLPGMAFERKKGAIFFFLV
jgi:hypothetical protein